MANKMTFVACSFPTTHGSTHTDGIRRPLASRGTVFVPRGILLATLFAARIAAGQDLTVDQSDGNSPYTVSSDLSYGNIYVGETGTGVINQSSNSVFASNAVILGDQPTDNNNVFSNGTYNLSGSGMLTDRDID